MTKNLQPTNRKITDWEVLGSKFNLKLQKLLTNYGKEFTPPLDGNDLYNLASDIWDAHQDTVKDILTEVEKQERYGRVESVALYIRICEQNEVKPTMKSLREFQAGQLLALAELSSQKGKE